MTETEPRTPRPILPFLGTGRGRRLAALTFGTIVAILAVIVSVTRESSETAVRFKPAAVFPDFETKAAGANLVTITDKSRALHLRKIESGTWVVAESHDYPASVNRLRGLFLNLSELRAIELKTDRPDWQASLGLVSPASGGGATLIDVTDPNGKSLASLMVGDLQPGGQSGQDRAFIRANGAAQAYLAEGDIPLETTPSDWLEPTIVDLPRDRVRRVALTPANGKAYAISRPTPKDVNFVVENLEPGQAMVSEIAANGIGAGAINVALDDVRPIGAIDFAGASRIAYETFDGLTVTMDVVTREDRHWLKVEAAAVAGSSLAAEAQAISKRTGAWAYAIPEWKANLFMKPVDQLLKSPPAAAPVKDDKGKKKSH